MAKQVRTSALRITAALSRKPHSEISETLVDESHNKIGIIYYDEEIAFEVKDYLVVYYFSNGKFLTRVIKGKRKASGATDHSGPKAKEAK